MLKGAGNSVRLEHRNLCPDRTTAMSITLTYSSVDNKWNQFASKGDRIQIVNQVELGGFREG